MPARKQTAAAQRVATTHHFGRWLLGLLALSLVWSAGAEDASASGRIKGSITPGAQNTFLLVKVRRRAFGRAIRARRAIRVSFWVRRPAGWVRIYKRVLLRHRFTHALPTRRICRQSLGNTRVALQVGMRYGEFWWNRWKRKWQRSYISLFQSTAQVNCPDPNDQPPGAPPASQPPAGPPLLPGFPPGRKAPPAQPPADQGGHHGGADQGGHHGGTHGGEGGAGEGGTAAPPPPVVVSRRSYKSIHRTLKGTSFSKQKLRTLRSWLQGLGDRKVKAYMIARLLKLFTFSSGKVKAARMLSGHALRPMKARHVSRIIKHISFSSTKLKVALYFCKGLADTANVHVIARQFTFSSAKRKILRRCR